MWLFKMKVVFVNPRVTDNYSHPLGILYISAVLKDYEIKVIDPSLRDSTKDIAKAVLKEHPDVIGFTATTLQFDKAVAIAKELKKIKDKPIIIGGIHSTVLPFETAKSNCFDYIIVGEGEITTSELLKKIKDKEPKVKGIVYKKDKWIFTGYRPLIKNLDKLPFPARHLLPEEAYFAPPKIRAFWANRTINIMISRGCPYRCIFCSSHLMFGRKTRFISPERVIEEIRNLRLKFKIDSLRFDDDTFTVNHKWTIKFCRLLKKLSKELKWKIKWTCQSRVNTINSKVLKEMKLAGCKEIDFGVESGSPRILKILKKGITVSQIIKAFNLTKKIGILRGATFIIGTPTETEEDLKLTEKLVKKIKPDFADFFFAVPFPNTELAKLAEKYGYKKSIKFSEWFLTKHTDKPVMSLNMPEERLIYWRSKLHNLNWFRNYSYFIRDPRFIINGIKITLLGYKGWIKGIKRVIKTGKIDSLLVETLHAYRLRLKN